MGVTKINGIPVFRATLASGRCGMQKISLVDAPAVQTDFLAFKEGEQPMRYAVQDEEKHLVYGVIMRADYPIYRYSKQTGEYYIMFSPDVIREMAEKYLVEGRQNEVNLQHEEGSDVEGVHLVQWFIKDSGKGIAPVGFEDVENGSLFGEFHIVNEDVWAGVKSGEYKGFSLEGIFGSEAVHEVVSTEKMAEESNKHNNGNMETIMEKLREKINLALNEIEQMQKGGAEPAPEAAAEEEKFGSVATDKGVIRWDGDAALEVGNAVKMIAEDGSEAKVEDGAYATESHTIEIAGGVVKSITEKEVKAEEQEKAEEAAPEAKEGKDKFAEMMQRMSASFDDKYRAIYEALADLGVDGYIVEAGDKYAVVELYEGGREKFYRYALSFSEDNVVTLDTYIEVFPTFATAEEKAEIESKYSAQEAQIADLSAQVEALKKQPVGEAAHEQFKSFEGITAKTGDERRDNVIRILGAK